MSWRSRQGHSLGQMPRWGTHEVPSEAALLSCGPPKTVLFSARRVQVRLLIDVEAGFLSAVAFQGLAQRRRRGEREEVAGGVAVGVDALRGAHRRRQQPQQLGRDRILGVVVGIRSLGGQRLGWKQGKRLEGGTLKGEGCPEHARMRGAATAVYFAGGHCSAVGGASMSVYASLSFAMAPREPGSCGGSMASASGWSRA